MQSSPDKTVARIASMLISLAAARLAVASCSSSSSGAFNGSLPQMLSLGSWQYGWAWFHNWNPVAVQSYWIRSGSCESRTYRLSSSRRHSKLIHLIISYSLPHRSSHHPQGQGPNPGPAAEGSRNTSLGHTAPLPVMAHTDSSGKVLAFFRGITNSTHSVGSKCWLRRYRKQMNQSRFLNSFRVSPVIRNSGKFLYCFFWAS